MIIRTLAAALAMSTAFIAPAAAQVAPRLHPTADVVAPLFPAAGDVARSAAGEPRPHVPPGAAARDTAVSAAPLYLAALAGGAAGFLLGGMMGSQIERANSERCYDFCGLGGFIIGAWTGSSVGMSLGAHLANGSEGNPLIGIPITMVVGAAGTLVVAHLTSGMENMGGPALLLAVPLMQVHTAVTAERITARNRARRQ
jgi:hypothetical protein